MAKYKLTLPSRRNLGEWADLIGTKLGLPETTWSERIAGEDTSNTQNWLNNASASEIQRAYGDNAEEAANSVNRTLVPGGGGGGGGGGGAGGGDAGGGSAPDLSNPVKRTEYAHSKGYDNWDQYQDSLKDSSSSKSQEELMKEQQRAVDNIFNEVNSYLSQNENLLRQGKNTLNQDVDAQLNTNLDILRNSRNQANRQIREQEISAEQRNIDNQNASRRLFNELQTGGRQRFGGASSAGQAFTELNNIEQQRRAAQNAQQYGQAMRAIESEKMRVHEEYNAGKLQLHQQAQQAKNEVLREFNSELTKINNMKANAAQNKGSMKLEALQNLRNQMFQIHLQENLFQQQLEAAKQQMLMQLQAHQMQLEGAAANVLNAFNNFGQNTTTNPNTNLGVQSASNSNNPSLAYTGMINRDEEQQRPMGRI
jgi:hypothetical protein